MRNERHVQHDPLRTGFHPYESTQSLNEWDVDYDILERWTQKAFTPSAHSSPAATYWSLLSLDECLGGPTYYPFPTRDIMRIL